jgi:predicted transposase YdaD
MTARAQKEYMDYCEITQGYYNTGKEDGIAIGKEEGIAIGEERGRSEAKLEAARNMILANLGTLEQISTVQALPIETVQQLAESLKNQE